VTEKDGSLIVNVDVHDVMKHDLGKGIPTPENYLKGELEGVTKERVEKAIKTKLNGELRPYIGPRYRYHEELPKSALISYTFNHLKK
jgi:hypothetical protein